MSTESNASDGRVQTVLDAEVTRIHDALTQFAKEVVEEGRTAHHTADRAISGLHAKLRKFLGPWV